VSWKRQWILWFKKLTSVEECDRRAQASFEKYGETSTASHEIAKLFRNGSGAVEALTASTFKKSQIRVRAARGGFILRQPIGSNTGDAALSLAFFVDQGIARLPRL